MNHDQLRTVDDTEAAATTEDLVALRERVGTFVQANGPAVSFPEGTRMLDTGEEPPRPLIVDEDAPTVYLTFPRSLLERLAPEAVQRLKIDELTLSRDTPTYQYMDAFIPLEPQEVSMDKVFDPYWTSGRGSGIGIRKPADADFDSTSYNLSADGTFSRRSEPHEGDPWPLPSQDPSYISEQERTDINAILDGLEQLDADELTAAMQVEVT